MEKRRPTQRERPTKQRPPRKREPMSDQPFRERRIPPEEVQRILQRALELAAMDSTVSAGKALTGAELEARLYEIGISPDIARRALESRPASVAPSSDGIVRVEREIELDGMLSPDQFEAIADSIQAVMKTPGRISAVGNKLTWTPGGAWLEPSVTVHAKDGQTSIRYVEALANRGQQKVAFGVLAGLAALGTGTTASLAGVAIAKAADVSAASGAPIVLGTATLLGIAAAIGSLLGLKRSFARRLESRSRFADEVVISVSAAVKASLAASAARVRVETREPGQDASHEHDADAEAAEAGEAETRVQMEQNRSRR